VQEAKGDLYATIDEQSPHRTVYLQTGFVPNRCESTYAIRTADACEALTGADLPAGYDVLRADEVVPERLRLLDDALRQDVPGSDGWRWEAGAFDDETFASAAFDPATYLVAFERGTGEYVGIVRVWNNPAGPRLGFIGVLPEHRRRGIARALLARVFAALAERGAAHVTTEVDDTNLASTALMKTLGARPTGGAVELVRRAGRAGRGP
jgi:ribosomal protein S18 acetylase RimI-like enzyme